MLTNFRKFPFHSLHFKLQKTCLPDILKGLLLGRIFRQTEGNTAGRGLLSAHLQLPGAPGDPGSTVKSHLDKERTLQPAVPM